MLTGTIDTIDGNFCIKYSMTLSSEPVQITHWWKIDNIERIPGSITSFPANGDAVTSGHGNYWVGPGYRVYQNGGAQAIKTEKTPVPCPPTRGKKARWENGHWEKLMARGWVSV